MKEYGIKVGTILFTLVEPHRGHEVEYNRWYERDHFYAGCLIGRSWFAGGRWVATRHLLGREGARRRGDRVGQRAGAVAARQRPDVRRARPHPHAHVHRPLGAR